MKKIIAILLLITLCFSHLGYYCVYQFQQYQLKEEMKKRLLASIPASALQVIELEPNSDLIHWEEQGREFSFKGHWYDVARIVKQNGKTSIYCLNDNKETELLNHYAKALQADPDNSKTGKHAAKFPAIDLITIPLEKEAGIATLSRRAFFSFNTAIISATAEINAPPPRV